MILADFLDEAFIDANVPATSLDGVLERIVELAMRSENLSSHTKEEVFQALVNREKLGTTGFGGGIAIPHCSFPGLDDFVVGFCRIPDGVDFQALDGSPVFVLFFIIGPDDRRNTHIQILSAISKLLIDDNTMQNLKKVDTASDVLRIVRSEQATGSEVEQDREKCLFHILVQREEYFDRVLQILSAEVQGEIAVIEAHNAGHYLDRIPLFSAYWGEDSGRFTRLILAVSDKGVCNDIIRRINLIDDSIDERSGLLVTVQDLLYSGGSLDF